MRDCVYQMIAQDMTYLKQRFTDTWNGLLQSIVDDAVDEWRKRQGLREGKRKTFQTFAVTTELKVAWLWS